jgi:chromosome segregation ATPase
VAENGDVHVCFLSEPIGNLYETSISRMWNSQRAMAQRSDMVAGRYLESGCSPRWCSWREGKKPAPPRSDKLAELRAEAALLADRAARAQSLVETGEGPSAIAAVRRMVASRDQRIKELEVMFVQLCDNNAAIHERAQEYIAQMEAKLQKNTDEVQRHIDHLEAKTAAAVAELEKNTEIHERTQQHIAHLEAKSAAAVAELEKNTEIHERTQKHIAHLEAKAEAAVAELGKNTEIREQAQQHIAHLEAKAEAALSEFRRLEQEFAHYRELPLIRVADALSRLLSRLRRTVLP